MDYLQYDMIQALYFCGLRVFTSHSCSPVKNVHNFSLEGPKVVLPAPFSYNYSSCSFLCMSNFNPLLHY